MNWDSYSPYQAHEESRVVPLDAVEGFYRHLLATGWKPERDARTDDVIATGGWEALATYYAAQTQGHFVRKFDCVNEMGIEIRRVSPQPGLTINGTEVPVIQWLYRRKFR